MLNFSVYISIGHTEVILLIGQQVCFDSCMKHENDVSDLFGCLQVIRICSFMREIKLYIVYLYVKSENDYFIKKIKHVLRSFIAWWKPRRTFGKIRELISENPVF